MNNFFDVLTRGVRPRSLLLSSRETWRRPVSLSDSSDGSDGSSGCSSAGGGGALVPAGGSVCSSAGGGDALIPAGGSVCSSAGCGDVLVPAGSDFSVAFPFLEDLSSISAMRALIFSRRVAISSIVKEVIANSSYSESNGKPVNEQS